MYCGEKLNSISHLVGAALTLVGFGALLTISIQERDLLLVISFIVFGLTLILLYTMSTLYHSFSPVRLKHLFQKLDHVAIYLLIVGTNTPFLLVSLRDKNGLFALAIIWVLAAVGLLLDFPIKKRIEWLQLSIYIAMVWFCILFYSDLQASIPYAGMAWLTIGGVLYVVGVVFTCSMTSINCNMQMGSGICLSCLAIPVISYPLPGMSGKSCRLRLV